jgi:hypothetical protein
MSKEPKSLREIINDCDFAIGEVYVKHFPLAKTGDESPSAKYVLNEALEENIKEWFLYNASEHYKLEEDN